MLAGARRRDGERGAAAVIVGITMSLLLIAGAFAVDLGMQRVLRRDLQAMADLVALDMSRQLNGDKIAIIKQTNKWKSELGRSVQANMNLDAGTVKLLPQPDTSTLTIVEGTDLRVRVEMGTLDEGDAFVPGGNQDIPDAVRVTATSAVGFAFGGLTGISEGGASRSAVAMRTTPSVCFSVGTKALSLNTSASALGPVLDHILKVNLAAVSYEGLVDLKQVYVPMADVLVELNVASVDQLATTDVSLANFMVAVADAMAANGDTASAAILQAITLGVPGATIPLADILALTSGGDVAGLTADVNVLDLLTAGIVAANGDMGLGITVPGLAAVTITEPPQIACGANGATARSSQIDIHVQTELLESLLSTLGLGLVGGRVDLKVHVADATATVSDELSCAPGSVTLDVATGAVTVPAPPPQVALDLTLSKLLSYLGPLNFVLKGLLQALGVDPISLEATVGAGIGTDQSTRTISYPAAPGLPDTLVVPDGGVGQTLQLTAAGVDITSGGVVGLLGSLLTGIVSNLLSDVVTPLVNNTLNPLLTAILDPVLDALGIKLGVAEVNMLGRPKCEGIALVG